MVSLTAASDGSLLVLLPAYRACISKLGNRSGP